VAPTEQVTHEADGRVLWRARVPGTLEIRRWILQWGAQVEVLAPPELRDEIAETYRKAAEVLTERGPTRLGLAMHDETIKSAGVEGESGRRPIADVGRESGQRPDPRLHRADQAADAGTGSALGLAPEEAAEGDLLDSAWLQRMRRISLDQSARWVFPTAEHSRFTHGLGVMHEAGLWARHLYPSLRASLAAADPAERPPSEGLVVETMRLAGLLHDVGHGPFAHFFDEHVLCHFEAPADPRRPGKA
jgi:hypothetical protein